MFTYAMNGHSISGGMSAIYVYNVIYINIYRVRVRVRVKYIYIYIYYLV